MGRPSMRVLRWSGAVLALVLIACPLQAQTVLTGTVTDSETGRPLEGALVRARAGAQGAGVLSSASGSYRLDLPSGTHELVVALIGFRTHTESVRVTPGSNTLDVGLVSDVLVLNPIQVTVGRKPEKMVTAPATTHVVGSVQIEERPAITVVDHLRASPGVDILQLGVQTSNVVTRGFQNLFSGSLHALTDNRIAGLPALHVNLLQLLPQSSDDIERIEVVLGPGSALYGPNTADGVLHVITKSPLDYQGTTLSLRGGSQNMMGGSLWSAHSLGENFAVKVSGQYLTGDEFEYFDPVEGENRTLADADPDAFRAILMERGASPDVAQQAFDRVGIRDFGFEQYSFSARADWQVAEDALWIFDYGRSIGSGLQATSLGTSQVGDWLYEYYQTRFTSDRLFLQAYMNGNGAGDTYALRDGLPFFEESRLFAAQAQYGLAAWDGRQDFTFGADYFFTNPRTGGTVHGGFEDEDNVVEAGAYLQSETGLTDELTLVLAGRLDHHSVLDGLTFSPRAALVLSPWPDQSFRLTYNRAYVPPPPLNFFADLHAGAAPSPLGELGFRLRAQGSARGFDFRNADGSLTGMRSPFNPAAFGGPGELLPVDVGTMWQFGVGVLAAQGLIDGPTTSLLASFNPTAADVGINVLDLNTLQAMPLASADFDDVDRLRAATNTTLEVGYQGVIENRFLLAADVWYSERNDVLSPLVIRTPLLLMNADPTTGRDMTTWLIGELVGSGMAIGTATCTALALTIGDVDCDQVPDAVGNGGLAALPTAVASSDGVAATGADVLLTYTNGGDVTVWGADLAFTWFVDDEWTFGGAASWVNDDYFADSRTAALYGLDVGLKNGSAPLALNAPTLKGSVQVGYRNPFAGVNAEVRLRVQNGYPVDSGVFVGTQCVTGGAGGLLEESCIDAYGLVDVTVGYKLPAWPATLQLTASNLLDSSYRSFVGVPEIGRLIVAQMKVDLF